MLVLIPSVFTRNTKFHWAITSVQESSFPLT